MHCECSQCRNEVCHSNDIPCNKHNINVLNNLFAVACNFLDEQTGNKTDFHNDLYQAKDSNGESKVSYICVSYQPFFLRSVKTQDEYMKAQAMFEETQNFPIHHFGLTLPSKPNHTQEASLPLKFLMSQKLNLSCP